MTQIPRLASLSRTFRACAFFVAASALAAAIPSPVEAGTVVSVETTGVTAGAIFSVTGTGFDATAANHQVTFTPAAGAPVTVAATSSTVVDAARGIRRVSLRVPAGLPVGPAQVRIVNTVTADVTNVGAIEILALAPAQPAQAAPGTTGLAVTVTAQGAAAFVSGQTRVTFGAGITVRSVTVQATNALVAMVDVAGSAAVGPRAVSVTVPRQSLVLADAFQVATVAPINEAPTVDAGLDQQLTLPNAVANLTGTATDDGRPAGSVLAVQWRAVSGPAAVNFSSPTTPSSQATFTVAGTYVLELRASDGDKASTDTLTVVVNRPVNVPPTVNAGADLAITLPTTSVALSGTVTDDGNPGTQPLTIAWSKVSGPGSVSFANSASAVTTATITVAGTYELRLSADDGEAVAADTMIVTVRPAPNAAPSVNAGADAAITLPLNIVQLTGSATDDGNPAGSALVYTWSKVSGPGVAEFIDPSSAATAVTFGAAGAYRLRLTVSDGDLSSSDDVDITVNPAPSPANQPPIVTASAAPATVTLPNASVALTASAVDDGKPGPALTYAWTRQSGPLGMSFDNPGAANTTATFSQSGTFVLRMTVSDGELTSFADVTVTVNPEPPPPPPPPPPTNAAPSVTAAATPSSITLPTASVALTATATDDGLPAPPVLGYRWTKQSGPGSVTFSAPTAASTNATFGASGTYTLRITVDDGALTGFADVSVTVQPAPPPPPPSNTAPQVTASASPSAITLPVNVAQVTGSATDDGRPSNTLSYRWSTVTGPAPVSFVDANSASTQARFTTSGVYVLRLTVSDGQDATDATVNVTVNPGAPPPPTNSAPTARVGGPYAGSVGTGIALSGRGSTDPDGDALTYAWDFGDGSTGTGPAPVHMWTQVGAFTITLTVTDVKGATSTATTTATVGAAQDRAPPTVTIVAPVQALPGEQVLVTADAIDNVAIASLTFTIDGGSPTTPSAPYQRVVSIPTVAAPGTKILVRASAVDTSNNSGSAAATITVVAAPDTEPPTVTIAAPDVASPGQTIVLTAVAGDNVGVASVRFVTSATTIATDTTPAYGATYVIPPTTTVGSLLVFTARATDFAGQAADSSATVAIISAPDTAPPTVEVTAPSVVPEGATFDVSASAQDNVKVASVRFDVDDVPVATVTTAPFTARVTVPATRGPGSVLSVKATATDTASLSASASTSTLVTGLTEGTGLVSGEVYDDSTGLPLSAVEVRVASGGVERTVQTDARGRFVVSASAGAADIRVSRNGFTFVQRRVAVPERGVVEMIDARLTPLATGVAVEATLGAEVGDAQARASFAGGALAANTTVQVTAVGAQGLRGLLPAGWSPVGAVDVAPAGRTISGGLAVTRANVHGLGAGVLLAVVTWDEAAGAWRFVGTTSVTAGAPLSATVAATGQVAWLLPDTLPTAPPAQQVGDLLSGVATPALPATAAVTVSPDPRIAVYAPGFRSFVSMSLVTTTRVSSGLVLRARVSERYDFVDAPRVAPEPFVQDIVLYQFPAGADGPAAAFAVSPSLAFEAAALAEGLISLDALSGADGSTGLLGRDGGRVTTATGEAFSLPADAVAFDVAARLDRITPESLGLVVPAVLEPLGAVALSLNGITLQQSGVLSIPRPSSLVDDTGIVVARLVEIAEATRLQFVAVGRIAGDTIVSDTAVSGLAMSLPGVRAGGRYVFLRIAQPFGFAFGVVRGVSGAIASDVLVTSSTLPLVAISSADGGYVVPALVGTSELTATDVQSYDAVTASVAIVANGRTRADLRIQALAPRVTSVTPADGEGEVSLTAPVVVSISEPIDPSSASAITVETLDGTPVGGTVRLSDANRVATFRADAPFDSKRGYRVRVAVALRDAGGRAAASEFTSTFTTIDLAPRPTPPAGAISATVPGATQQTTVTATQGTAGLRDEVKIFNLTRNTFQIALVNPDGSFSATLDAKITDKLRIGITTPAGVQTTLDLERFSQQNPDGSISSTVDASGGVLQGPNGIRVSVHDGTFPDGAVVTMAFVDEAAFPLPLTPEQKTLFAYSGGIRLDFGGAVPTRYLDVSIPAAPGDTDEDRWVIAGVDQIAARTRMVIADTARVIDGQIRTSSPPCPGVLAAMTYGVVKALKPVGLVYGRFPNPDPFAGVGSSSAAIESAYFVTQPSLGALSSAYPFVASDAFVAKEPNICLPALSGRVTVTPTVRNLHILAGNLTPADRTVFVRNTATGETFSYPRTVVPLVHLMKGGYADAFEVYALAGSGPVPLTFRKVRYSDLFTTIRVDMDQVTVAATAIRIRNSSLEPAVEVDLPIEFASITVPVAGSGNSADYVVRVTTASGATRTMPFTLDPQGAPGALTLKVLPLTIDPGSSTFLRNLTKKTQVQIPNDAIVAERGGVTYPFDGEIKDRYAVEVRYDDTSRLPDVFVVPQMRIYPVSAETGVATVGYDLPVPPQDEPYNVGAVSGDKTRPFVVATPGNQLAFDPRGYITIRFSEGLDRESVLRDLKVVDADGVALEITIALTERNSVLTIIPQSAMRLGREYKVMLDGVTDASGNAVDSAPIVLKIFEPRRLGETFLTGQNAAPRHLELWRARDAQDVMGTYAMQGRLGFSVNEPITTSLEFSDAEAPKVLYTDNGGLRYFEVEDWAVLPDLKDRPLSGVNSCTGKSTFTGTLGIMARQSQSSTLYGFSTVALDVFDLTKPNLPCRFAIKVMAGTNLQDPNVHEAVGYAKSVAVLPYEDGILAYAAIQFVGLASVDVTKVVGAGAETGKVPLVPGNYRSVDVVGARVIALEQTQSTVDVFTPSLTRVASVPLNSLGNRGEFYELKAVDQFHIDANRDGVVDRNELRMLVLVAGRSGLSIVDITDLSKAEEIAFVETRAVLDRVSVDVLNKRAIVSSGGQFLIIDLSDAGEFGPGYPDDNLDEEDDRIVWRSPGGLYAGGGGRLLAFDTERGLVHVSVGPSYGGVGGIDTWALNSLCCDVRVDMTKEVSFDAAEGDATSLIAAERTALSNGMKAGLDQAKTACAGADVNALTILEQGSGACIWKPNAVTACSGNYQPGLSDHDYEVYMPDAYFANNAAVAKCVTSTLTAQFTDPDTKEAKPIVVNGRTLTFDDITFFPFPRSGFEAGKNDITPPKNDGGDPTGDLAMGRQQLLLLWLLGGEYVEVPGYNVKGVALPEILLKLQTQTGIPRLEGYEWANLQRFNLYKTMAFVRIAGASNATSAFHDLFIKQLHDTGKAGIRTVFARMVADPRTNGSVTGSFLTKVRRSSSDPGEGPAFDTDACRHIESIDTTSWTPEPCKGFEHYAASLAARTITELHLDMFTPVEVFEVVHKMYRVKADVKLPAREDIRDDADANEFVAMVAGFVDAMLQETLPAYEAGLPLEPPADRAERTKNLDALFNKSLPKAMKKASLHVVPRIANLGFRQANAVPIVMYRGVGQLKGTRVKPKTGMPAITVTLAGGESTFLANVDGIELDEPDDDAERNLLDSERVIDKDKKKNLFVVGDEEDVQGNPYIDQSAEIGVIKHVAFTVDLDGPTRRVREAVRGNNYDGFYFYVLDRANPVPQVGPTVRVPLPVDESLLDPDAECDPPPDLFITHHFEYAGLSYHDNFEVPIGAKATIFLDVYNRSTETIDGVRACSSVLGECIDLGSIPPQSYAPRESREVPAFTKSGQIYSRVSASSANGGTRDGQPILILVGCEPFHIVQPTPSPNPAGDSTVGVGGTSVRHYRVVDKASPPQPKQGAMVEVELIGPDLIPELPLLFTTDRFGNIGSYNDPDNPDWFEKGVAVTIPQTANPGELYMVRMKEVDGEGDCIHEVRYYIQVTDRTYQATYAAGPAAKVGGRLIGLDVAGSFGAGFDATLDVTTPRRPSKLTMTSIRSIGAEAGAKIGSDPIAKGTEVSYGQANASVALALERLQTDKYAFAMPLSDASAEAVRDIFSRTVLTGAGETIAAIIPGGDFVVGGYLDDLFDHLFALDDDRTVRGGSVGISAKAGLQLNALLFRLGAVDGVEAGKHGFNIGLNFAGDVGFVAGFEDQPKETPTPLIVASGEFRGSVQAKCCVSGQLVDKVPNEELRKRLQETIDRYDRMFNFKADAAGSMKFELARDALTNKPKSLTISVAEKKTFGLQADGEQIVQMGDGSRRVIAVKVTDKDPAKLQRAIDEVAFGSAVALYGAVNPLIYTITDDVTDDLLDVMLLGDEYEVSVERGTSKTWPYNLFDKFPDLKAAAAAKNIGTLEVSLKVDTLTKYTIEKGVMIDGLQYPLERYANPDPLVPADAVQQVEDTLTEAFTRSIFGSPLRLVIKRFTFPIEIQRARFEQAFSPSGVTLDVNMAAEPASRKPFDIGLVARKLRQVPGPDAPLVQSPLDVVADYAKPRYGIGGIFSFLVETPTLAAPADLEIRYLDDEVAALDESSLRIYRFNDVTKDWELHGGTVDLVNNKVVTTITDLGSAYTVGARMPAGRPSVTAQLTAASPQSEATVDVTTDVIRMNTGEVVPDGTLFTVSFSVANGDITSTLGSIATPDADGTLPGVQVASTGGVLQFVGTLPAGVSQARVVGWPAGGGVTRINHLVVRQ